MTTAHIFCLFVRYIQFVILVILIPHFLDSIRAALLTPPPAIFDP